MARGKKPMAERRSRLIRLLELLRIRLVPKGF
jgi:hypothetical protein